MGSGVRSEHAGRNKTKPSPQYLKGGAKLGPARPPETRGLDKSAANARFGLIYQTPKSSKSTLSSSTPRSSSILRTACSINGGPQT